MLCPLAVASRREAVFTAVEAYNRAHPRLPRPRPPGCSPSCSPTRMSAA